MIEFIISAVFFIIGFLILGRICAWAVGRTINADNYLMTVFINIGAGMILYVLSSGQILIFFASLGGVVGFRYFCKHPVYAELKKEV